MPKICYVRVAADKSSPGKRGPLFKDHSFEYVSIFEDHPTIEERTYLTEKGRKGEFLNKYMNKRKILPMHYDPEFRYDWILSVYGDDTIDKDTLNDLNKGDILVFYTGLDYWPKNEMQEEYCLIGYIIVDQLIRNNRFNLEFQPENAHKKRIQYIMKLFYEELQNGLMEELIQCIKHLQEDLTTEMDKQIKYDIAKTAISFFSDKITFQDLILEKNWNIIKSNLNVLERIYLLYGLLKYYWDYLLIIGPGKLLEKAIRISYKEVKINKKGNKVIRYPPLKLWESILGHKASLMRKGNEVRFVPNTITKSKHYIGEGNLEKFQEILLTEDGKYLEALIEYRELDVLRKELEEIKKDLLEDKEKETLKILKEKLIRAKQKNWNLHVLTIGNFLMKFEDWFEEIDLFEIFSQLHDIYNELGYIKGSIDALNKMASQCKKFGEYEDAIFFTQDALNTCKNIPHSLYRANQNAICLRKLADLFLDETIMNLEETEKYLGESSHIALDAYNFPLWLRNEIDNAKISNKNAENDSTDIFPYEAYLFSEFLNIEKCLIEELLKK
ncbi:MAG: hypothetical protein ACTSR8_13140 [Promethearchaeota archaeon]